MKLNCFDWQRALRAGHKFLVTVGAIALIAWLPNQAPLYICFALIGLAPVAMILYFLEGVKRGEERQGN